MMDRLIRRREFGFRLFCDKHPLSVFDNYGLISRLRSNPMSLSDSVGRAPRVVPFPERTFKPNAAHCFSFVDETRRSSG